MEGELDELLAQENTCLGRWLGWCTPGRPSSDLLDLAENSLEADLKAEKDLSDLLATALPSTGAHRVMVERKGPGIFSTGLVEHLNEQLNSHQVLIIRGPAGSVCYPSSHACARGQTHTCMKTLTHTHTQTQAQHLQPCFALPSCAASVSRCCIHA